MASKIERMRAKWKNVQEGTRRTALGVLHSGETLVAGGLTAYVSGRLSDANGEWGFRGIPYAYIGGGVLFLAGLGLGFSAKDGSAAPDLFALGTGVVGGQLFPDLHQAGLTAKAKKGSTTTSGGRTIGRTQVPPGLGSRFAAAGAAVRQTAQPEPAPVDTGSAFQRTAGGA